MNLKLVLIITLLVLIIMGMVTYGYLMYSINGDTNGVALITKFKLMVYAELVIQLLQVVVCSFMAYRT